MPKNIQQKLIAIAIVEDNRYMRESWRILLEGVDDFIVLGTYRDCESALADPELLSADVVLMDISLPGISGIEGVRRLKEMNPEIATVMCTVHEDDQAVFDALCAGAVGYLLKKTAGETLIRSIREAADGGSPMTPGIARKVIATFQSPRTNEALTAQLTAVESEILGELARGKSYRLIAESTGLSVHGVGYHLRKIYEKLEVSSRGEAVARGLQKKLIPPPDNA